MYLIFPPEGSLCFWFLFCLFFCCFCFFYRAAWCQADVEKWEDAALNHTEMNVSYWFLVCIDGYVPYHRLHITFNRRMFWETLDKHSGEYGGENMLLFTFSDIKRASTVVQEEKKKNKKWSLVIRNYKIYFPNLPPLLSVTPEPPLRLRWRGFFDIRAISS